MQISEITVFIRVLNDNMGQTTSAPKPLPPIDLLDEWNLTSDNSVWARLALWDSEQTIVSIRCFYYEVGLSARGLPCVSIRTKSTVDNRVTTVRMPTCYLRTYVERVYLGETMDSSLLFKNRPDDPYFDDLSYDLIKKTYRKLNQPCNNECASSAPIAFRKMIFEMKQFVDQLKERSVPGFLFSGKPTSLEYINMYAVMYNQPATWEIVSPIDVAKMQEVLNFENLRPSNYFYGATSTFKLEHAQKWVDDSKEFKTWLMNNCPDCGHCGSVHIIDFLKVAGRTCPKFSAPLEVRFVVQDDGEYKEDVGTFLRECDDTCTGLALESMPAQESAKGERLPQGHIDILYGGNVRKIERKDVISMHQPRVEQEYVGCLINSRSSSWLNNEAMREGWFTLSNTQKQTHLDPCWTFDDYQQNVVDRMSQQKSLLVNHYMGTGKTLSATSTIVYLRKYKTPSIRTAVIIMPNSLKSDWKKELTKFGVWSEHRGRVEGNLYIRDIPGGLNFYLWTYEEAIENMHTISELMSSCVVVFDEAHRINEYEVSALNVINVDREALETRTTNADTLFKFTKMVTITESAQYMIMLTGTPVSESVLDIVPLFNMLGRVEQQEDVFPRDRVEFMNEYMYLDEKKASVTKYIRTYYKGFGSFVQYLLNNKAAPLVGGAFITLGVISGIGLPAISVPTLISGFLPASVAIASSQAVFGKLFEQEKILAITKPRDDQVLFRINAIQLKPILTRYLDYFDNEDFESSARNYPYKVFRFERVQMSAYQLVLYAAIRLNIAGVTQQRLSDLLDYRTISGDDGDDRLANADRPDTQYELPVYFNRRNLSDKKQAEILETIAKRYYANYRIAMGVKQSEDGSFKVFASTEYMNDAIQYQVELFSDKTLRDVSSGTPVRGFWKDSDNRFVPCTASSPYNIDNKKRLIVMEDGRTFQVSKFSTKWLSEDFVEVSFRSQPNQMVAGPFWVDGTLSYAYVTYDTASEAKKAHKTFLPVYTAADTDYLAKHRLTSVTEFANVPTFPSDLMTKPIVPMICFNERLLLLYMSATIDRTHTERRRSANVRTYATTPATIPSTPPAHASLRTSSSKVYRKPKTINERYMHVPMFKSRTKIYCLSPGDAANVFADYPRYEKGQVKWLGTSPKVDDLEIKSRMNASVAINLKSHLSDEKLLRLANLRDKTGCPKWELMWRNYLNKRDSDRVAKVVYYEDADDTPKITTVQCQTSGLPRTIVYSQFSEGRGGILDFCNFLLSKGAVQCLRYKSYTKWRRMNDQGVIEYISDAPIGDTFTFCLFDKELPDDAFYFSVKDKVRWNSKIYVVHAQTDDSYTLRRAKNELVRNVPVHEIRPLVFGNRGDENTALLNMFNTTDTLNCALLHYSITEGKSFKRTHQIHIMEPMLNPAQLDQVIARAVRKDSHKRVSDPRQRFVEVIQWAAVVKHDAMGQVGEDTIGNIMKDAVKTAARGRVGQAVADVSRKTFLPGIGLFVVDMFDFANGFVDRAPGWVFDWTGKRIAGQGPDESPEKRGMRQAFKNCANYIEQIVNTNRQNFQSDPQMKEALIEMQLLWEQAIPDLRFLSAAFVTDKNEKMISQTPDDLVFAECLRRKDYMAQLKAITRTTYTDDILKKRGLQETPASVLALRDNQTRVGDKIHLNR